jgi:thiol-disulfide isomerase/thioredoxin
LQSLAQWLWGRRNLLEETIMNRSFYTPFFSVTALVICLSVHAQAQAERPKPLTVDLALDQKSLDMENLSKSHMGFIPAVVKLVDERPAAITKEPAYVGKPKYGAFKVGNGPKAVTFFAIDEDAKTSKIYIDYNQNGDLTDDGSGNWDKAVDVQGVPNFRSIVTVHASWGTPLEELESGSYSLYLYKRIGATSFGYSKVTGRTGKVTLGGKRYSVEIAENNSDGIFTVPATGDLTRRPCEFYIDLDGDGTFKGIQQEVNGKKMLLPERFSMTDPIQIDEQWYYIRPNVSGSQIQFITTTATGKSEPAQSTEPKAKIVLSAGEPAPDFIAQTPDGKPINLSDFKGKVVLLDFWATWCGPCQASMPGLEKLYQDVKDQGVVVLSLNVYDTKAPFDIWIKKHSGSDYNFNFAFDPAGRDDKTSIAAHTYGVTVIPAMFVVGRDGKLVGTLMGSGNEANLKKILNDQGIKTKD